MTDLSGVHKLTQYIPAIFFLFILFAILMAPPCLSLEWQITTVDTVGNVGQSSSLAVDENGYPHISYIDKTNHALSYAYWTGTNWEIERVPGLSASNCHTSIALDGSGYPHVSFYHVGDESTTAMYAYRTASSWEWYPLWSGQSSYYRFTYTSLEIDNAGYCHVLCSESSSTGQLVYIWESSTGWQVDMDIGIGGMTCLAIDSTNCPHFSVVEGNSRVGIFHRYRVSQTGEWTSELVEMGWTFETSFALDESGFPHMSYAQDGLKHAYRDSVEWNVEELDVGGGWEYIFLNPSLEIDCQDYPHIAYVKEAIDLLQSRPELCYCHEDSTGWRDVDLIISGGEQPSLALDAAGVPHISFAWQDSSSTEHELRYACPIMALSDSVSAGELILSWSEWPWSAGYRIHGMGNSAYFEPDESNLVAILPPGTLNWSIPVGVGDPDENWTYIVIAVDATEQELCRSNRIGEHDYALTLAP